MLARKETLRVRLEHARLQRAWLLADNDEARSRIEQRMSAELGKLQDIERRYFTEKPCANSGDA